MAGEVEVEAAVAAVVDVAPDTVLGAVGPAHARSPRIADVSIVRYAKGGTLQALQPASPSFLHGITQNDAIPVPRSGARSHGIVSAARTSESVDQVDRI